MMLIPEPEPKTRAVLVTQPGGRAITGVGPLSYTCGKCGNTLLKDVEFEQVRNIVIKCGTCGSFNETPPVNEMN
jgi:hypothetical protein